MFKKLSKFMLSLSLAAVTCGIGSVPIIANMQNHSASAEVQTMSVDVGGRTYVLEGNVYNEETFWKIDTAEKLSLVSFMVSVAKDSEWAGYNFELANDINLASKLWTGIGTFDNPFTGKFNGNGYTINGLNAAKDSCESEVFYIDEDKNGSYETLLNSPTIDAYYKDVAKNIYYQFEKNKGYVLQSETPASYTEVSPKNYYYYGLFGYLKNAEITDVVMGKDCYSYKNTAEGATAYSGIMAAYAENTTFYNIYDAMADANVVYSQQVNAYRKTADTSIVTYKKGEAVIGTKTYYVRNENYTQVVNPVESNLSTYYILNPDTTYSSAAGTTFDSENTTYYRLKYTYEKVENPSVDEIDTYYEPIYKIDTGFYTYYYIQESNTLRLYTEDTLTNLVLNIPIEIGKSGDFVVNDKGYYYDYTIEHALLCLNLKERYVVNSIVTSGEGEEEVTVSSIEVAGITYYLDTSVANKLTLYKTSTFDEGTNINLPADTDGKTKTAGYVTLNSVAYPYRYENSVFKILTYSEICTIGFADGDCQFYKGNYYRLASVNYVGIGSIDETVVHDGTLNIQGGTYYYIYTTDKVNGEDQLALYTDAEFGYPIYIGRANSAGVGTISIDGTNYIFNYDKDYNSALDQEIAESVKNRFGDLTLITTNNYMSNIPYTVAKTSGSIKVEELENGTIFSFNVTTPTSDSGANFYIKGTTNYITSYKMIYKEGVGLSTIEYNNNFVSKSTTLPTNYNMALNNNYFIVSDEPGYIFEYWTVPTSDGKESIVYADSTPDKEFRSYVEITEANAVAEAGASYASYENGIFVNQSNIVEGVTSVTGLYKEIDSETTINNIIANNYQVNAVWSEKSYNVKLYDGENVTTKTVGYGIRWDTFVSSVTKDGYDLTGLYYYESSPEVIAEDGSIENRIYAYSLNYNYDNYGNLTNYSYIRTQDQEVVADKKYYTLSYSGQKEVYTEATLTAGSMISDIYYERVENVAIYGATMASGEYGIQYYMVNWKNGLLASDNKEYIHIYTRWQKQPVNGKVSFTNTTDLYIKATEYDANEKYYEYNSTSGAYTQVSGTISESDIGNYYVQTTKYLEGKYLLGNSGSGDCGFKGVVEPISIESNNTNFFMKLDDYSTRFQMNFKTNTGYKVNYIVPADNGTFAMSDIDFYVWDYASETLTHITHNGTEYSEIEISTSAVVIGRLNDSDTFTADSGASYNTIEIANATTSNVYIDLYQSGTTGTEKTSYVEAFIKASDSATTYTQVVVVGKNGNNYTYSQKAFTKNSYKLWIDIEREVFDVKLTVTQASGLEGNVNFEVYEDGLKTQTIEGIGYATRDQSTTSANGSTNEDTHLKVKYDSEYVIIGTPDQSSYSVDLVSKVNMGKLTESISSDGAVTLSGQVSELTYTKEEDGQIVECMPEYIINLKYSTFGAYADFDYGTSDENKYSSDLYTSDGKTYGVEDLIVEIEPLHTDSGKQESVISQTLTDGENNLDITNFSGSAVITFNDNAYYNVESITIDLYNAESEKGTSDDITVLDNSGLLAKISYNGTEYYVNKTDITTSNENSSINNATLYSLTSTPITNGGTISGIGRNAILVIKPVISKDSYTLQNSLSGMNGTGTEAQLVSLKDITGADTTNSGNAILVKNGNVEGSSIQYSYGDAITLQYTLNSTYYNFDRWIAEINGTYYDIAIRGSESWVVGENFSSTSSSLYTKYASATINGETITLTFNQSMAQNMKIYGIFKGKTATLNLSGAKDSNGQNITSLVQNYDGSGSFKAHNSIGNGTINAGSSTLNTLTFGDTEDKTIVYSVGGTRSAGYRLLGFAVYDANSEAETTEEKITIIYLSDALKDATGSNTLTIDYYDLFTNYDSTNTSLLEALFAGSSELYLIPVVEQKTVNITLVKGDINATGSDVTGLLYYVGGQGLNLENVNGTNYADDFAKTGYTPTSWLWKDAGGTTVHEEIDNVLNLNAVDSLSNYYDQGNIVFNRVYTANKYTITFDFGATGGDLVGTSGWLEGEDGSKYLDVTFDQAYTLPNANKVGYTFNGWLLNGQPFASEGTYTTPNNITLIPDFTANKYNVKVNANKGLLSDDSGEKIVQLDYDSRFYSLSDINTQPTRAGYTFDGWYAVAGANYLKIDSDDILSVDMNTQILKYVDIDNSEVTIVLMAAWVRIDDYYSLTKAGQEGYEVSYSSDVQEFDAISDLLANGVSILDAEGNITLQNNDQVNFVWSYNKSEQANYVDITNTDITKLTSILLTNVSESGYYKLTIEFVDQATPITQQMLDQKTTQPLISEIHVRINPLTLQLDGTLAETYEGVFNGTSTPVLNDLDLEQLNNNKIEIDTYKIGNGTTNTFVEGINVGDYSTIRLYFHFKDGYTYVSGNYANVFTDNGRNYFEQAVSIKVNPLEVQLAPLVSKIAYTGVAQTIDFAATVEINGESVVLQARGTLTSGNYGNNTTTTNIVVSETTMSISSPSVSVGYTSNYTFTLTGSLDILANVNDYGLIAHMITKESSQSESFSPLTIATDEKLNIVKIVLNINGTQTTFNPNTQTSDAYTLITMSDTTSYVYVGEDLIFQMKNNNSEVDIFAMYPITTIEFDSQNAVYETAEGQNNGYLFGLVEFDEEDESLMTKVATTLSNYQTQVLTFSIEAGKTYSVGYTDVLKLTIKGLGLAGNQEETKFVKLGSPFAYSPERASFAFNGWKNGQEDTRISISKSTASTVNDIVTISGTQIVPAEVSATWTLLPPVFKQTNDFTATANEGQAEITITDIVGEISEDNIEGYNSSLKYAFEWFDKDGNSLGWENSIKLPANTTSNGTYKLRAYNSETSEFNSEIYTEITFNVEFTLVELSISTEDTYTTKTGNFETTNNIVISGNKFNFDYSYKNTYDEYIFINVPASTSATKEFKLSDSKASGNIYFKVEKIKDANGDNITATISTLADAGTYKITLLYNDKIYKVASEQSFEVVINPFTTTFTDESLKTLFNVASEDKMFTKVVGNDNGTLTRTIYISQGNIFSSTTSGLEEGYATLVVKFAGATGSGLGIDEQGNTLSPGAYDITLAQSNNDNFRFNVEGLQLVVTQNTSGALTVSLLPTNTTFNKIAIDRVALEWNGEKYVLNGYSGNSLRVSWDINYIGYDEIVYENPTQETQDFILNSYNFNLIGEVLDAKDYTKAIITIVPKDASAIYANAEIGNDGTILTINPATITVTTVEKPCDLTSDFNTATQGHIATISGLIDGDNVTVTGQFSDTKFGTGITVTDLAISGEHAGNYVLANTTISTGKITSSNVEINVSLKETEFDYGVITKNSILSNIFSFVFKIGEEEIDNASAYFNVEITEIAEATYSTGNYLNYKEGGYILTVEVTSDSFSNIKLGTFNFTINQKEVVPTSADITKKYNGNTNVEQIVTADILANDKISISAQYESAEVGTTIKVILTLDETQDDNKNYKLSTYELSGRIEERDGVTIYVINNDNEAFVDGQPATGPNDKFSPNGNNFDVSVAPYNSSTAGEDVMDILADPTKAGYTFNGWFTSSTYETQITKDNILTLINSSIQNGEAKLTIYAKWTINEYEISLIEGTNTSIELAKTTFKFYDLVTFVPTSERGYSLNILVYKNGDTATQITPSVEAGTFKFNIPAYNVVINTSATAQTYNISYELNSGDFKVDDTAPTTHTFATTTNIPNPARLGYDFTGWVINGEGSAVKDLVLGSDGYVQYEDIELTAQWKAKTYKIFFTFVENDEHFNAETLATLKQETDDDGVVSYYKEVDFDATISALPVALKPGYGFTKWVIVNDPEQKELRNGDTYETADDIFVEARFEAGSFNITLDLTNVTATVYASSISAENEVLPTSGSTYALTGGTKYSIVVTPKDGYTVEEWQYNGGTYTNKAENVYIVSSTTIAITATANNNILTITINEQDKLNAEITAKVNGSDVELTDVVGGGAYTFRAPTDSVVVLAVGIKSGYTLDSYTSYGLEAVKSEHSDVFTLTGFVGNASLSLTLKATKFNATINQDTAKAIEGISFVGGTIHEFTSDSSSWTGEVTTGSNIKFIPSVTIGYKFAGVEITISGRTVAVSVDSSMQNILDSGINIAITSAGQVTIAGYTDEFAITLLSAREQYKVELEGIAINEEGKNDTTVSIELLINDAPYTAESNVFDFGSTIAISASADTAGYKFVGWYTAISTGDEGEIVYVNTNLKDTNANYSFDMASENVKLYAVFTLTRLSMNLSVVTDDVEGNVRGGQILNTKEEAIDVDSPLYRSTVVYKAKATSGYKFKGWFYVDTNGDQIEIVSDETYTITTKTDTKLNIIESTITFAVQDNMILIAKFEAKAMQMAIRTGILINGVINFPNENDDVTDNINYGFVEWGTYNTTDGFVVNTDYGTSSTIYTKTDSVVYIKVTANNGYLIDQIVNDEVGTFVSELVDSGIDSQSREYNIYKITGMNADNGAYRLLVRFYSTETTVAVSFVRNNTPVEGGDAVVTKSAGIVISGNRSSYVTVKAITNSTITFRAYTRLGYLFDSAITPEKLLDTTNVKGNVSATILAGPTTANHDLGYTKYIDVMIEGYAGGYLNITLPVVADTYNVRIYSYDSQLITTVLGVSGGEHITESFSVANKNAIKDLIENGGIEGYTLRGFYTSANGSGRMYLDGKGESVAPLNDNGYYWNGSKYVMSPYYSEDHEGHGTFSLFAVYNIDKTAITIVASPETLEQISPTVAAKVVISNLNSANSWTIDSDPFYAEVLHGATISATAPKFAGHVFAFWKIERVTRNGESTIRFNANETMSDLAHDNYSSIKLTAVYYVNVEVSSNGGGKATVSGNTYVLSEDGTTTTLVDKTVTSNTYLSSLDKIVYKAQPDFGYSFMGWYDEEGTLVSTQPIYEILASESKPTSLRAEFVGDAKTLKIIDASTSVGKIKEVARLNDNFEEETITNWSEFAVKVGDIIIIRINIEDSEYEAIWSSTNVESQTFDSHAKIREYHYIVKAEDEISTDLIEIKVDYRSRKFDITMSYDLDNKSNNDELKIAGSVTFNGKEVSSNHVDQTIFGRVIVINISPNKNYKVSSIMVDGVEVIDNINFYSNGTLRVQTNTYDYENGEKSVSIEIKFARVLWTDEILETYTLTGKGTTENPYKITCEEDLAYVAYMINILNDLEFASANYELMKDIDLSGKYWIPIGTVGNPFTGSFDFNVYVITNASVVYGYTQDVSYDGVFGETNNAKIFRTESNVGLIIGIVAGAVALIGIGVGIFLGIRAKKKREMDKLANS